MSSPLADTLFRPTTLSPVVASAAPVREPGTRSRAGNAMNRTRSALMSGAAEAVRSSGTKVTMAQVAMDAGVAKATLYNHFRTRDAVLASLVVHEVQTIIAAQAGKPLAEALADAATRIAEHPVRSGLAHVEPAVLARLGRIDLEAAGWAAASAAVGEALCAAGRGGTDTVLRWLASYVVSPSGRSAILADIAVLMTGLPVLG